MLNTFVLSFQLRNTYKTNSIIYSLKSIPLVRRILPDALYASPGLKTFANVISILMEIAGVFLGKLLYLVCLIFPAAEMMSAAKPAAFVHIFFFLTITGGLLNTQIFNPTKDKYYAMFLMRMDAREYTLVNYGYFLLKMAVGFLPFTLLFGLLSGVNAAVCVLMPFFVCGVKLLFTAVALARSHQGERVHNENLPAPVVWIGVVVTLAAAYIPPFFGYAMPVWLFAMLCIPVLAAGAAAAWYVVRFPAYRAVYRILLSGTLAMNQNSAAQAVQQSYQKKIEADISLTSRQSGYKYFNELFMKRHSRLLTKSAKKITLILLVLLAAAVFACLFVPQARAPMNELMLTFLPYFLFVMYFVNRGRTITQAMFINCDHSMLTYRFYRQPKAILALFAERLKYIAAINLIPATVIAVGLPLLLFLSGGTDQILNYVLLFVSILAMSVFFSVHTLVMYYLLQPYNIHMESKNATYGIVNYITYLICYIAIGKEVPTLVFGIGITAFCLLYVLVALLLAYRLAPKTFRLRS